jgi:hypothetical protein
MGFGIVGFIFIGIGCAIDIEICFVSAPGIWRRPCCGFGICPFFLFYVAIGLVGGRAWKGDT